MSGGGWLDSLCTAAQVRERAFKVLDRFFEENPKVLLDMKAELKVGPLQMSGQY